MAYDEVFDTKETAAFLGAHVETIRRLARRGEIPAFKIGKDWRFRREALLKWAETHHLGNRTTSVLVVDADPYIRNSVRQILELEGLTVNEAKSGAEGLEWIKSNTFAAVLFDLTMPDMNGTQFLNLLRQNNSMIPVIIITGYPDSELMAEATQYGPLTLLAKPLNRMHLLQAVQASIAGGACNIQTERMPEADIR